MALAAAPSLARGSSLSRDAGQTQTQEPAGVAGLPPVREGFRVELVCAEPLVTDPIAIDWGPDGRLWVVDMGDYPTGGDGSEAAAWLRQVLGGHATATVGTTVSQVFLDDLNFPTGVMPWRCGVLITCAPEHSLRGRHGWRWKGRSTRSAVPRFRGRKSAAPCERACGGDSTTGSTGRMGTAAATSLSLKTGEQVDIHARDFRIRPDTGAIRDADGHGPVRTLPRRLGQLVRWSEPAAELALRTGRPLPASQSRFWLRRTPVST